MSLLMSWCNWCGDRYESNGLFGLDHRCIEPKPDTELVLGGDYSADVSSVS